MYIYIYIYICGCEAKPTASFLSRIPHVGACEKTPLSCEPLPRNSAGELLASP